MRKNNSFSNASVAKNMDLLLLFTLTSIISIPAKKSNTKLQSKIPKKQDRDHPLQSEWRISHTTRKRQTLCVLQTQHWRIFMMLWGISILKEKIFCLTKILSTAVLNLMRISNLQIQIKIKLALFPVPKEKGRDKSMKKSINWNSNMTYNR